MQLAIAALVALLPIINPFSTAPMFLAITEGDSEEYRQKQARKAVIYMVCILIAFLVSGSFIMNFFGLSIPGLRIAGGILVAVSACACSIPRMRANRPRLKSWKRNANVMCPSCRWRCPVWLARRHFGHHRPDLACQELAGFRIHRYRHSAGRHCRLPHADAVNQAGRASRCYRP